MQRIHSTITGTCHFNVICRNISPVLLAILVKLYILKEQICKKFKEICRPGRANELYK